MERKLKNSTKKRMPKQAEEDSIEQLKNKIKHQKDALIKIIKSFSR